MPKLVKGAPEVGTPCRPNPGTDAASAVDWSTWHGRIAPASSPLRPGDRVLLLGAHPDDETIGAGRLVAAHDGPCEAVVLTAGEGCGGDDLDRGALAHRRLAEWRAATAHLGAVARETPRWPDGDLASHQAPVEALLDELVVDHDVVLCTWAHDPHPDHRAAGLAARAVCGRAGVRLVEYPVWAPFWWGPDEVAALGAALGRAETGSEAAAARTAAVAEYASQTLPLRAGWSPIVPAELLRRHDEQLVVVTRA